MSDEDLVSRRQLFTGWARGLAEGLNELVLPLVEGEVQRLRQAFDGTGDGDAPPVETVHPWRDLLEPRADDPVEP